MRPEPKTPPAALARRGLARHRDNLGPGDRVAIPPERIVNHFFDEIRARLAAQLPEPGPARPAPASTAQQADLPGMEHPALYAAYCRAGLARHVTFDAALADPATRHCLEIMAKEAAV